jgi:hypothetical protein
MSAEPLRHMAMPKLVGAPAYGRPAVPVIPVARPFDPDDLPLQALMTAEERALLEYGPPTQAPDDDQAGINVRPFSLRGLTDRLRGFGS